MRSLRPVPDTPPRAIIYMRQSTHREESISLDLQERACRDYCDRLGYEVVAVEADPGISGRVWSSRPKVQQVMAAIEAGTADVVVLWKWSRLSRSRKDWAVAADRVDVAGGRIESATEPIDTATASGRFARGVMTEYAAFQSEQIGEQWEEVRQRRLSLGLPASGRLPFGWNWVDGAVEPNADQAPYVVAMYSRYLAGHGAAEIANWLNQEGVPAPNGGGWRRTRPFTVMDSPIHAGLIPYRGKTYPGAHGGIVDQATWDAYRAERERRTTRGEKPRKAEYILSMLVRCSCGARMTGKGAITGGRWYGGYICSRIRGLGEHPGRSYISALALHPPVEQWLMEFDVEGAASDGRDAVATSRRDRVVRKLSQLEDEAASLLRERARGDAPASTYDKALAMIAEEREALEAENRELNAALRSRPDAGAVHKMREDWKLWSPARKNLALRRLISRIVIAPDGSSVELFLASGGNSSVLTLR